MKKGITFLLLSFLICSVSLAQVEPTVTFDEETGNYLIRFQVEDELVEIIYEPPNKVEPIVNAEVLNINDHILTYSYNVRNEVNADQKIESFAIEYYSRIENITVPNQEWEYFPNRNPYLIWAHTLADPSGVRTPQTGIESNSSAQGFSFTSSGIPTIVNSFSEGSVKTLALPLETPIEIEEQLNELATWPENMVNKKTIGPKDPPVPFIPLDFLETIIEYKAQSCDLGWIENQGICRSLEANLDNVKRQLEQGRTQTAANNMQAFLNEVEAIKDQHLNSEAYALLRYNGEYFLRRLN